MLVASWRALEVQPDLLFFHSNDWHADSNGTGLTLLRRARGSIRSRAPAYPTYLPRRYRRLDLGGRTYRFTCLQPESIRSGAHARLRWHHIKTDRRARPFTAVTGHGAVSPKPIFAVRKSFIPASVWPSAGKVHPVPAFLLRGVARSFV